MTTTSQTGGNPDRSFVRKAMKAPMLEAEHELNLARRWRDHEDERALHELTTAYIGTGVCCSYDDRNSKWLYALSIAGLTGVLSAFKARSVLEKLVKNGPLSGRLAIVKAGLGKPLAKIDNRALFALLPFILVSTSVLERGADPLLRRSAEEMQNLGGYTSAVALKNELLKSQHCAAVFTAFPLVRHNPILADYRDSIRPGRDLNWFLHSPRAISPNCRTFWYFKPGIYPQASQADKELFLARLEDGTIVHIEGYAYKVPGKFD